MERLFPGFLLACIGDGREPHEHELAAVTDKVWREAYRHGAEAQERAKSVASAALSGARLTI